MTTTKSFYPNTIAQSSCSSCREWANLNNLKSSSNYSQCGSNPFAGKTGTYKKPAVLKLTNFKIKIPTGAMITKITVQYAHQKVAYKGGTPNIPAPTIKLLNVSSQSTKGSTPTTSMTDKSVSFSFKPTTSNITSSSFGVQIEYPANANTNQGYLRLKYVRIIVTYTEPSYSVGISKGDSLVKYEGDSINLNVSINNKNKVNYNPSVTITLPEGVVFNNKVSGKGSFTKSGNNVVWNPSLAANVASSTAVIKVNLTTAGNKVIKIKENLKGNSTSITINVSKKVVSSPITINAPKEENISDIGEDSGQTSDDDTIKVIRENDTVSFKIHIPTEILNSMLGDEAITLKAFVDETEVTHKIRLPELNMNLDEKKWIKQEIIDNTLDVSLTPLTGVAIHPKVLLEIKAFIHTPEKSALDLLLGGEP